MTRWRTTLIFALAAGALTVGGLAASGDGGPPAQPDWVRGDGTIDHDRLPPYFNMIDETGKSVGRVPAHEVYGNPGQKRTVHTPPNQKGDTPSTYKLETVQ